MEALALAASIVTICGPIVKAVLSQYRQRRPKAIKTRAPTAQDFLLSWPKPDPEEEYLRFIHNYSYNQIMRRRRDET